jgi:hypothetical protein
MCCLGLVGLSAVDGLEHKRPSRGYWHAGTDACLRPAAGAAASLEAVIVYSGFIATHYALVTAQ